MIKAFKCFSKNITHFSDVRRKVPLNIRNLQYLHVFLVMHATRMRFTISPAECRLNNRTKYKSRAPRNLPHVNVVENVRNKNMLPFKTYEEYKRGNANCVHYCFWFLEQTKNYCKSLFRLIN